MSWDSRPQSVPLRLPPIKQVRIRAIGERRFSVAGRTVEQDETVTVDEDIAAGLVAVGKAALV